MEISNHWSLLTHYLPVSSYDDRGSKFKFYIKKETMKKISYKRRDYVAVAGKQQFSIARTKLPPLVIAGGNGLRNVGGNVVCD